MLKCGISSAVERNLAKVVVIGSNPIFRFQSLTGIVDKKSKSVPELEHGGVV